MTTSYRYELVKGGKKESCPSCGKPRKFVRYKDSITGKLLPDKYGRCDREVKCSYHLNPYNDDLYKDEFPNDQHASFTPPMIQVSPISFIDEAIMKKSLFHYETNNFIMWLRTFLSVVDIKKVTHDYMIGSSKHWNGSTVFWQVDKQGRVRSGKIMLFDKANGKRVKKPFSHINWVHKVMQLDDFNLSQCYFGEHLVIEDDMRDVAIVESEKTAIIASIYLPEFIWLASGSLNGINIEKSKILKGRTCHLFPDLGAVEKWEEKAQALNFLLPETVFNVSTLLEELSNTYELVQGCDLADYLPLINRRIDKSEKESDVTKGKLVLRTFGDYLDYIEKNCPRLYKG